MKGQAGGTVLSSFVDGGGLIFGMFLFYVIAFGIAWYCGYGKRDQMRREAVEKQIAKERAVLASKTFNDLVRIYVFSILSLIYSYLNK